MKKTILLLILCAGVFGACKTSFRISVQKPSVIRVPTGVESYGIVNHVTRENSPEKIVEVLLNSQSINGNVVASERAEEGILRALERSNYLGGKILATSTEIRNENGAILWENIDSICAQQKIDAIIELIEIKTISPVGGSVLASATGQTNTRLDGYIYTNLYYSGSHASFERLSVRRYYTIPLSGSTSIIDILNDVKRKQEYYRALGYELGYGTGALLYPNWVWVGRDYYTRGSKVLKRARPMIKEGNWDIAEKQLLQDIDHGKEKIRGRVLFNLALVKEGQGDLDQAIHYAEAAALECGNKLANDYLVKLRKRKREMEEL